MDITEAFRTEDISKTDFFDFVVTPDVTDANALQQFNRSMKSVGIFLESYNNNNNEDATTERKETNNNHLVLNNGANEINIPTSGFVDSTFWNSSPSCDKESVRWEASMLEDLNCWSHEQEGTNGNNSKSATHAENTDGAIYTLTVLNGADQATTWYRPPDGQEEEIPVTVQHNATTNSPHASMTTHQNAIDIDSFLNSIPTTIPHNSPETNPFQNGFPPRSTTSETPTVSNDIVTAAESVKSEFSYEDSGYADNKEEICNQIEIVLTSNPSGQFNNNNDWKLSDSNATERSTVGSADSLLRNALQGKTFLTRYNGSHSVKSEKPEELRRVLGTPPSSKSSSETAVYSTDIEEDIKTQSPLMAVSLEGGTVVMFDGGSGTGTMLIDSDNPSSAQSMDDIFLSQLDAVSYPEDYEKLKRIENEVAESVEQYCSLDHSGQSIYIPTHINDPSRLSSLSHLDHSILSSMPSTTTSSKSSKKYSKRSSTTTKTHSHQLQSPGSSSGIRKERSLHYCNICSKGFKDKYSVNVHIRTHTGEKPFACSLCGKSFRQKAHLAKHYHTHLAQAKNAANGGSPSKPATNKSR